MTGNSILIAIQEVLLKDHHKERYYLFEKDEHDEKWDVFLDRKDNTHLWRYQITENKEEPVIEDCVESVPINNRFEILDL